MILQDPVLNQHLTKLVRESAIADLKKEVTLIENELLILAQSRTNSDYRGEGSRRRVEFLDAQLASYQEKLNKFY